MMILYKSRFQYHLEGFNMKDKTILKIMRVLWMWQLMDRGVGITLGEVAKWSGVPRMTTYRYLRKLAALDMIAEKHGKYRNAPATFYAISNYGSYWLNGYEIPF
jgi:DNA-binding IclR family transcriptional regulator